MKRLSLPLLFALVLSTSIAGCGGSENSGGGGGYSGGGGGGRVEVCPPRLIGEYVSNDRALAEKYAIERDGFSAWIEYLGTLDTRTYAVWADLPCR
ncbi:MAG: hypothetical protein CUN57_01045 [Phototrophicales bacterium]|nr:MAG: hypothetical protein CUN57_01045 [Phototrophicales bacterium]